MNIPLGFGSDHVGRRLLKVSTDDLLKKLDDINRWKNDYKKDSYSMFQLLAKEECIKIILNHRIRKCARK